MGSLVNTVGNNTNLVNAQLMDEHARSVEGRITSHKFVLEKNNE